MTEHVVTWHLTADDDLVGLHEIAERSGRSKGSIRQFRRRYPDFPAPVGELAMGPVWRWGEVRQWLSGRKA